jgi:hypothetical protein
MKLTDLHKNKGMKINSGIKAYGTTGKPAAPAAPLDRREQRKLDQARGLVPFACKLDGELLKQLQAIAGERKIDMGELVGELLTSALGGEKKAKAEPKVEAKAEPKVEAKAAPEPASKAEAKAPAKSAAKAPAKAAGKAK